MGWSSSLLDVGYTPGGLSGREAYAITPGGRKVLPWGPQVSGPGDCFETGARRADERG